MAGLETSAFAAADFQRLADFMTANARARLPGPVTLLPGDLAWRLPGCRDEEDLLLVFDTGELIAWGWFDGPTDFEFDLRFDLPAEHPALALLLAWAEEQRRLAPPAYPRFVDLKDMDAWAAELDNPATQSKDDARYLTTSVLECDEARIAVLERSGYAPTEHFAPKYLHALDPAIPAPELPAGWRIRPVAARERQARIRLHRSAWKNSTWGEAAYAAIQATSAYDPHFDLVLEIEPGILASYCICWFSAGAELAIFEPVGTAPDWRGTGAGTALIHGAFATMAAAGARFASVETAGFNHPAQRLYEGAGFERVGTSRTYMKVLA